MSKRDNALGWGALLTGLAIGVWVGMCNPAPAQAGNSDELLRRSTAALEQIADELESARRCACK